MLVDWVGGGGGAAACTLTLLFSPCTFLVAHQGSEVEAGIEMVLFGKFRDIKGERQEIFLRDLEFTLKGAEVWILEEHWFLVVVGAPLLSMYSPA